MSVLCLITIIIKKVWRIKSMLNYNEKVVQHKRAINTHGIQEECNCL